MPRKPAPTKPSAKTASKTNKPDTLCELHDLLVAFIKHLTKLNFEDGTFAFYARKRLLEDVTPGQMAVGLGHEISHSSVDPEPFRTMMRMGKETQRILAPSKHNKRKES